MDTTLKPVLVPQLNPNEKEALLARLHAQEGQQVVKGEILCTLETTKATFDIHAEEDGYIIGLRFREGDMVRAGEELCYLSNSPENSALQEKPVSERRPAPRENLNNVEGTALEIPQGLRITKPALQLASRMGLDLNQLPRGPLITEKYLREQSSGVHTQPFVPSESTVDPTAIVVYGGGGHGKSVIELIRALNTYRIVGILDDGIPLTGTEDDPLRILGIPVLGGKEKLPELYNQGIRLAANAVGGIGDIQVRVKIFERLSEHGFVCPILVHPTVYVEPSASLSAGVQVFPHAYIGSEAHIGFGVIINTGAIVSHECQIGNFVNLSPGAILAGQVTVGDRVLIGMGVTVNIGVRIGSNSRIGNNATIKADVPANSLIKAGTIFPP